MGKKLNLNKINIPQPKGSIPNNNVNAISTDEKKEHDEDVLISEVKIQLLSEGNFNSRGIYIHKTKSAKGANARMVIIKNHKLIQTISRVNKDLTERSIRGEVDLSGDAF